MLVGCEPSQRRAASVLLTGQSAAAVEELVSIHDVQAYRQTTARTVGASSEPQPRLLERHRPAGVTATPAGGPLGSAFCRPRPVASESLECAGRTLREDSRKGSLLSLVSDWKLGTVGLSAFMLTYPFKLAPASASAALGLFTRLAPRLCGRLLLRRRVCVRVGAPERQLPG
jgi:hypothetical protein